MARSKNSSKRPTSAIMARINPNSVYSHVSSEVAEELIDCSERIKIGLTRTVEEAVMAGKYFTRCKELLNDTFMKTWIEEEFVEKGFYITETTVINYMRLWKTWNDSTEEHKESMKKMSLSALYVLCRSKTDSEFRLAALDSIAAGALPPTREDITDMRALYRQEVKLLEQKDAENLKQDYRLKVMKEDNISEDVIELLLNEPIVEDPKERKKLSGYSKKKQYEIAKSIIEGKAKTVKEAYEVNRKPKIEIETVEVDYTDITNKDYFRQLKGGWKQSLYEISSNEINFAIVECPLKFSWAQENLKDLAQEVFEILEPGGFAIFILGHKSLLYSAALLEPLEPIHTLCIRKQPGNSSFIPGVNIIGASVVAALCYKPPFKSPRKFFPDLLTIDTTEVVEELSEVESGIEKAFDKYIESLLVPGTAMTHIVCEKNTQFNIGHHLAQSAKGFGASVFYSVGDSTSL